MALADTLTEDSCRNQTPKSVIFRSSPHTNCQLHSRDFSDCFRYHKLHPFWDVFHTRPPQVDNDKRTTLSPLVLLGRSPAARFDPLKYLGLDVMLQVLAHLDACSLARCGLASKEWMSVAHRDPLWESKCTELWTGKSHVPPISSSISKFTAYSMSVKDSQRVLITGEELCGNSWEFRFKSAAPEYWLELDPSRRGEAPMRRFFHPDGSQTAPPGDPVWGGHECSYTMVEEYSVGDDKQRERYVRINRWPKMTVSRTSDWGWELNNDFYVYKSVSKTINK